MSNPYAHLDAYAQRLVSAPPGDRIRSILQPRFVEYPAARRVRQWADQCIQNRHALRRPWLLITAGAGTGKTSLLLHLERRYPDRLSAQDGKTLRPIIRFQTPLVPDLTSLQQILLTQLGASESGRSAGHRSDLLGRYLRDMETQIVLFDDFQHARDWSSMSIEWIKSVIASARVKVVCAGRQRAERLVRNDLQWRSLFRMTRLPRWTAGNFFGEFLQAYERTLPLQRPSHLGALSMQRALLEQARALQATTDLSYAELTRLVHADLTYASATCGIVQIIQAAAVNAVVTGCEHITRELLPAWRDSIH